MRCRPAIHVASFLALLVPASARAQAAASAPAEADPMVDLFARKCASCHTVGKGTRVGPDLKGVLERRPRPWLDRFVKAPSTLLDSDAQARELLAQANGVRMPDLGLSADEVQGLLELVGRCSKQPCELAGKFAPVSTASAGDKTRGREIFLGRQALKAGGIACISCHTVRGTGSIVAGGLLAKDLTNVFGRLGDEGLDAALRSPVFPLMNKVFADHPLAPEETFALRAFLYEANRAEPAAEDSLNLGLVAVLGVVGVLIALNLAWARRLGGVRTSLLDRTR